MEEITNYFITIGTSNAYLQPPLKEMARTLRANAHHAGCGGGIIQAKEIKCKQVAVKIIEPKYRVRKLTPKECWRLMDFDDADFDKAKSAGISDSQLYKQAGNSIIVAVLEAIFGEMI